MTTRLISKRELVLECVQRKLSFYVVTDQKYNVLQKLYTILYMLAQFVDYYVILPCGAK